LLVTTEIALAATLLIAAGLVVRSLSRLLDVDPGFKADSVLTMELRLPESKYPDRRQRAAFVRELLGRIETLDSVQAAGAVLARPMVGGTAIWRVRPDDQADRSSEPGTPAQLQTATPHYFAAMGIPLLRGRSFTQSDHEAAPPVMVINDAMARRFWPGTDPLGRRILADGLSRTIVGVVGGVKHGGLRSDVGLQTYVPDAQNPLSRCTWTYLVVRVAGSPTTAAPALRTVVHQLDPDQPVEEVTTMTAVVSGSVRSDRLIGGLLAGFAAVALTLAAIGFFAVLAAVVTQRTHEIAVRLAIGAQASDVLRLVLGEVVALLLIGIAAGVVAALAATRTLTSLLFGVTPTDPLVFGTVPALLVAVALLASYLPARRAAKVDPMVALRCE
jgi:putative ABC transport system permease protein